MLRNLSHSCFCFSYVDTHRIVSCPRAVAARLFSAIMRGMQTVNSCPTFGDIFLNYFSPPSSLLFLNSCCPDRDREAWCAAVYGSWRVGHDWATGLNGCPNSPSQVWACDCRLPLCASVLCFEDTSLPVLQGFHMCCHIFNFQELSFSRHF